MPSRILTDSAASITELKKNPMAIFQSAQGDAIAILNRNEPAFYCVPPALYEYLLELAEDEELVRLVHEREDDDTVAVDIESLKR